MGITKSDYFSKDQNEASAMFKALAHPARIAILEYLMQAGKCICNDIVEELPLAQATISQHLRELKLAGFIKGSIEGKSICYCVDESRIAEAIEHLGRFVSKDANNRIICC